MTRKDPTEPTALLVTRIEGTERSFDVERTWDDTLVIWAARVILDETGLNVVRGDLTLGELLAITTKITDLLTMVRELEVKL